MFRVGRGVDTATHREVRMVGYRIRKAWRVLRYAVRLMAGRETGHSDHYWPWKIHRCANRFRRRLRREGDKLPPTIVRPIFIVGAFRTGTTLLAECLNQHPGVAYCLFEMSPQWRDLAGIELGHGVNRSAHCPPLNERDAPPELCERVREGFAEILAWQGGREGRRLLNKAPHFSNKLPFLREVFPDASLVVAARDIRSTVASVKELWESNYRKLGVRFHLPEDPDYCWSVSPPASARDWSSERTFPGGKLSVLADYWLRTYEIIDRTVEAFDEVVLMKHGDFVRDPEQSLRRMFGALGDEERCDGPARSDRYVEERAVAGGVVAGRA